MFLGGGVSKRNRWEVHRRKRARSKGAHYLRAMSIFGSPGQARSFPAKGEMVPREFFQTRSYLRLFELPNEEARGDKAEWKETKIRTSLGLGWRLEGGGSNGGRDRWAAGDRPLEELSQEVVSRSPLPSANPFFWQRRPRLRSVACLELLFRRVESRLADRKNVAFTEIRLGKEGRSFASDRKSIPYRS